MDYKEFLMSKIAFAPESGFSIGRNEITAGLKPHQKDAVQWAIKGGAGLCSKVSA